MAVGREAKREQNQSLNTAKRGGEERTNHCALIERVPDFTNSSPFSTYSPLLLLKRSIHPRARHDETTTSNNNEKRDLPFLLLLQRKLRVPKLGS